MTSAVVSKQTWMSFVKEGSIDERILSNEIIQSWQFCRQHKVNPFDGVTTKILEKEDFENKIRENHLLLDLTKQNLPQLQKFLKGWSYVTILTDSDGCILYRTGENTIVKAAEHISFKEGVTWIEEEVGTNAIGLVKRLQTPINVNGYEHFARASHSWNCFAAPIINQKQELIGVLNISSMCPPSNVHYVLSSVQLAAESISLAWKKKVQEDIGWLLSNCYFTDSPSIICTQDKTICALSHQLIPNYQGLIGFSITEVDKEELKLSKTLIPIINENRIIGYRIPIIDKKEQTSTFIFNGIQGISKKYHYMLEEVEKVAPTEAPVHILGETGTGKELIAEAIHHNSHRSTGPFIKLNCAAIPEQLLESELFGYEPGAFTGANKKGYKGKFEQADGGTLFLDEIGDIPHSMQKALLRVLQQKELTRLGGTDVRKVNVRIITAANIDIRDLVKQGKMREDFFYRIYVYPVIIPPLRERKEDIKSLIEAFFQKEHWLPHWRKRLISIFTKSQWLGNVRELQNSLERCKILYENKVPTDDELFQLTLALEAKSLNNTYTEANSFRAELEIKKIKEALIKYKGHVSNAAKELNISRATLYRKMKKYDLY
jgi:transcriptional regulator of acetoin/glycerol metabolism